MINNLEYFFSRQTSIEHTWIDRGDAPLSFDDKKSIVTLIQRELHHVIDVKT